MPTSMPGADKSQRVKHLAVSLLGKFFGAGSGKLFINTINDAEKFASIGTLKC